MAKLIYILRKTYATETMRSIDVCAFTKQVRAIEERDLMNGRSSVPQATYCVYAINLYSGTAHPTYMRISTGTMAEYRKAGYRMEFGIRTTAGHFKAWLQDHAAKHRETEKFDIQAALSRLT